MQVFVLIILCPHAHAIHLHGFYVIWTLYFSLSTLVGHSTLGHGYGHSTLGFQTKNVQKFPNNCRFRHDYTLAWVWPSPSNIARIFIRRIFPLSLMILCHLGSIATTQHIPQNPASSANMSFSSSMVFKGQLHQRQLNMAIQSSPMTLLSASNSLSRLVCYQTQGPISYITECLIEHLILIKAFVLESP